MSIEIDFPFTSYELTKSVNRIANSFGLLRAMGLAPIETKRSDVIRLDRKNNKIMVLGSTERGGPSNTFARGRSGADFFQTPHFSLMDSILVDDIKDEVEVQGNQITAVSIAGILAERLKDARTNHSITLEFLRLGMLRGIVYDGEETELIDLYDMFGIQQKVVQLGLDDETTNLRERFQEVNSHIRSNLLGDTMTRVAHLIAPDVMTKILDHSYTKEHHLNAQNPYETPEALRRDYTGGNYGRTLNLFGEHLLIEYEGKMPIKGGGVMQDNVQAGKGHSFPLGTQNLFKTYETPAFHMSEVGKAPQADTIFMSTKILDHGEGVQLKSQTNRVAICKQPECLVELTA